MVALAGSTLQQSSVPGFDVGHPTSGERAILDVLQHAAHCVLRPLVNDSRSGHILAKLSGVAYSLVHAGHTTLVDEVGDQLDLVHALKVGQLGTVTRLDERVKSGSQQGCHSSTETVSYTHLTLPTNREV